jgi:hypothetical protein
MSDHHRKLPSALKHGVYSATDILPGESRGEFEKWHRRIIAELHPMGPLEEQAVDDVARLTWRKRNMLTVRLAERAQRRNAEIRFQRIPTHNEDDEYTKISHRPKPAVLAAAEEAVRTALQAELGGYAELIEVGERATSTGLMQDLKVEELLDVKIDRTLKRLLHLKGIKSLTAIALGPPSGS